MNNCKNCKWWFNDKELSECNNSVNGSYYDIDSFDNQFRLEDGEDLITWEYEFDVKTCHRPKEFEMLSHPMDFGVKDGSGYSASLYTAENFGCVNWEEISCKNN